MKRSSLVTFFGLMIFIFVVSFGPAAQAVDLDGVQIPDRMQVQGKTLYLNGYGVRTYSILGIHIYAASLYLEQLSTDPNEIIQSPETKAADSQVRARR